MRQVVLIKDEIERCKAEAERLWKEAEEEKDLLRADLLNDMAHDLITRTRALRWTLGSNREEDC